MSVNSYLRMYAGWEMDPDFFIATLQCLKKNGDFKLVVITFSEASESAVKKWTFSLYLEWIMNVIFDAWVNEQSSLSVSELFLSYYKSYLFNCKRRWPSPTKPFQN